MANRKLRVRRLDEQRSNDDPGDRTPAECVQMVWPLTQQAWAFRQAASSGEGDHVNPDYRATLSAFADAEVEYLVMGPTPRCNRKAGRRGIVG
jgi:hypothetical protein